MKALFVFAHPDDETFGTGGTIAKLVEKGAEVKLICATKGEAGQCGNPAVCPQEELPKVREKELRNAAKILGIQKIYFLELIDGTLHTVSTRKIVNPILSIMQQENPDVVFTFDTQGGESGHKDHACISVCATQAFKTYAKSQKKHVELYHRVTPKSFINKLKKENKLHKPFGYAHSVPDALITTKINISDVMDKKMQAANAHKSQHQDWERIMKRNNFDEFNYEYFSLVYENGLEILL